MAAQLAATVYVRDPDTHQTVELAQGTCPEPRLAALVTSRAAWVDGKLPRQATAQAQSKPDDPKVPTGDGPDGGSGAASGPDDSDQTHTGDQAAPAAKKTAAKKTATSARSRGRDAADQSGGE